MPQTVTTKHEDSRLQLDAAIDIWPTFLPYPYLKASNATLTIHQGYITNAGEQREACYVQFWEWEELGQVLVSTMSSPMVTTELLRGCLQTAGYRHRYPQPVPRLDEMLRNAWIVAALIFFVKDARRILHHSEMRRWQNEPIDPTTNKKPPMPYGPEPISFVSTRIRTHLARPQFDES